jgi:hypothetical protein
MFYLFVNINVLLFDCFPTVMNNVAIGFLQLSVLLSHTKKGWPVHGQPFLAFFTAP